MGMEQEILDILETTGAHLKNGHFKLVSGNHTDSYVHVRLALAYPEHASTIGKRLADEYQEDNIDAVVGFAVGGIILAKSVAAKLNARLVLAERKKDKISFSRGQVIEEGENVLIMDDVLTTGELIHQALSTMRNETRGVVKGVGVVVDRSKKVLDFGVKTVSLLRIDMNLWPPGSCPKCAKGDPLTDLSSPDKNPSAMLETLPEEVRPVLMVTYLDILQDLKAGKPLEEVLRIYRPTHEFSFSSSNGFSAKW